MAKLEERLKKRNACPPAGGKSARFQVPRKPASIPSPSPFPAPKMKRRVLVLALADMTNYKEEHLDELTTKRIVSRLENSGTIIPVDPRP